jgi:hypothetical protein
MSVGIEEYKKFWRFIMSWSIEKTITNEEGFADVGKNLEELETIERPSPSADLVNGEQDDQIDTAIKIGSILLATEVFQNAAEVKVSLSGHANPEHKEKSGWSNESVGIRIDVKRYRKDT